MSAMTFFILLVSIIAVLFLAINLTFAPHKPYGEKASAFECGFHSFLQTRLPFNISFFLYAILFLLFDLEILLIFPYVVSAYVNSVYGLVALLFFTFIITIGFVFELGKGVLNPSNRQSRNLTATPNLGISVSFLGNISEDKSNKSYT